MGNTDNIDGVSTDQIKNNMLSLGETVVTLMDIIPMPAESWVICQPLEALFELF